MELASGQNLGPLTSAYALPSSCAADLKTIYKIHTVAEGWYYLIQGAPEQTSCYPSGYNGATTEYYAPGVCPKGFTAACSTATASETVYNCCPTDYDYSCLASIDNPDQTWQSTLGCTVPVVTPSSGYSQTATFVEVSDGTSSLVTSVLGFSGGINAYSIQVRVGAADAATVTSVSSSSKATVTKATPHTTSKVVASTTSETPTITTSQTTESAVYTYPSEITNTITSTSSTSSVSSIKTGSAAGVSVARGLSAIALMSAALFVLA